MIQFNVFPGGKKRALTFSYDDGPESDVRLAEIFNKYGVKCTFHLNGTYYKDITEERAEELRRIYAGHEVACHTLQHGWPTRMPAQAVIRETWEDRQMLEGIFGYPVVGMSYPCGNYGDEAISAMRACGIVYSRTIDSTGSCELPVDFMRWHPTCHHNRATEMSERFIKDLDNHWGGPLLYIWGHSFEFRTEEDWRTMEDAVARMSGNDKVWYATNIEIYNYMMAQRMLQISADETMFYNPSSMDVWVSRDHKEIICIPAGQTVVHK